MRIETQETPPAENTEGPWEHLLASSLGCLASASSTVAVQLSVGHEPHTQHGVDSLSSEMPSNDSNETWINPNPHPFFRYRHTLFGSRRLRRRIILKNGECNVVQGKVAKRRRRYLKDIFTTLVDAQWRWTLLVFALNFVLSWLSFAFVWWIIVITHGDLNPRNNPTLARLNNYTGEMNEEWQPCVTGINGFVSCFLFSVETQHTIGYGSRSTTEECPEAIFVMCLQSICGVMIQAFMVGVVFAKLSRPKKRTQTLLFSRNAVICLRNGELCLMFRVGDMRKSHIVEAHVRAQYISRKVTCEGELLSFHQQEMLVGGDGREDRLFFIWPTTIVHRIDAHSPLYTLRPQELPRSRFEIVVLLEGVVESTGMTTQARSSYLPSEILWGRRFEPLIEFRRDTGQYSVDFSQFDATYKVETPECSAKEIEMTGLQGKLIIPDGLDTSPTSNTESTSLSSHAPFTIQE